MVSTPRRRLWGAIAIALGLCFLTAAAFTWYFTPPWYEAYALLKISARPPVVLKGNGLDREEFKVAKRTQAQLIQSNTVLNGVVREKEFSRLPLIASLGKDPVPKLRERVTVDFPEDAEIMRVSMRGNDPEQLIQVVNKLVAMYLKEIVQREKEKLVLNESKLQGAYEKQAAEYQKQLDALRALESIHKTSGSEEAQLKKELAKEELFSWIGQRRKWLDRIEDNELELMLEAARNQPAREKQTAADEAPENVPQENVPQEKKPEGDQAKATAEAAPAAPGVDPAREILAKKQQYFDEKLALIQVKIREAEQALAAAQSFSSQVTAKQEELESLRVMNTQLRAELDHLRIERLAPDRITQVEEATLLDDKTTVRWLAAAGVLAGLGLALTVLGGRSLTRKTSHGPGTSA